MKTESINFRVEMCNRTERNDCKTTEEIKQLLAELIVSVWIIDSSIDFNKPWDESVKRTQRLIARRNLKYKEEMFYNDLVHLSQIEYKTIESVLRDPSSSKKSTFLKTN